MEPSVLAAWWGALTGTLALLWEMFTWFRKGPRLRLSATTNMQVITPSIGLDETLRISLSVRNVGDSPTTLTHFCGMSYSGRFNRLRRKRSGLFVVTTGPESPIPFKLGAGETWSGMVLQDQVIGSLPEPDMWLYLGVQHSMAEKPDVVRVRLPKGSA
jgi:hypothetical protein